MDKIVLVLKMEHSNKGDRSNPSVTEVQDLKKKFLIWMELTAFF